MTGYLRVRNWQKFQHYKNRTPPWIKLHWELFASEDWTMLADASKLVAIVCMLVASRNEGLVPDNPDYLKRVAYLDRRPDLKPLIDCGFLEKMLADASEVDTALADACASVSVSKDIKTSSTEKKEASPRASPVSELVKVLDAERAAAVVEHRQKLRKPLTPHAAKLLAEQFAKCRDPCEAADTMIANGWQGIKPEWMENRNERTRQNGIGNGGTRDTFRDAMARAVARRTGRDERPPMADVGGGDVGDGAQGGQDRGTTIEGEVVAGSRRH